MQKDIALGGSGVHIGGRRRGWTAGARRRAVRVALYRQMSGEPVSPAVTRPGRPWRLRTWRRLALSCASASAAVDLLELDVDPARGLFVAGRHVCAVFFDHVSLEVEQGPENDEFALLARGVRTGMVRVVEVLLLKAYEEMSSARQYNPPTRAS